MPGRLNSSNRDLNLLTPLWWNDGNKPSYIMEAPTAESDGVCLFFPEEFWKAEMSLFEETASGQTKKQANGLTRNLISSGLFRSQTKSPFIKHWTDIVQHNKLVKVKFKLCLLSWSNIKALLCWTIFPLPNVCLPAIDSGYGWHEMMNKTRLLLLGVVRKSLQLVWQALPLGIFCGHVKIKGNYSYRRSNMRRK